MEARLVRLDDEQLERLREKVTFKSGVVVYRKPDWLHAAYREGKSRSNDFRQAIAQLAGEFRTDAKVMACDAPREAEAFNDAAKRLQFVLDAYDGSGVEPEYESDAELDRRLDLEDAETARNLEDDG